MSAVRLNDEYMPEYMQLIRLFPLAPIRSEAQFGKAIRVMKDLAYSRATLNRDQSDYLIVLSSLIAQYEKRLPRLATKMTPAEALTYLMEVNELSQKDLVPLVGHKSNLYSFLSGKRALSKASCVRLAEYFKVSPTLFLIEAQV